MRRATVTIRDDLEHALESFVDALPARPSLASVVEAALEAYLVEPHAVPSRLPKVMRNRARIKDLSLARGVDRIALFGSVASGTDGPESDVDFWVHGTEPVGLFALAALRHDLATLLGEHVDLVTLGGLPQAERDAVLERSLVL
ncbi:nucleotidyltransferase family protein [Demequina sp.]|uniref:nucleotidyltransferase family protein n=1 Tax=Demequina sp. TaxID=2050685 RepID=UPI003D0DE78B